MHTATATDLAGNVSLTSAALPITIVTPTTTVTNGLIAFPDKDSGGNVNLFGRMDGVASGPSKALNDKASGKLWGIGLTMEAIEQNPVMYELMTQHTWQTTPVDLDAWIPQYVLNRYRTNNNNLVNAWQILRKTVYNGAIIRDGAESTAQLGTPP